METFHTARHLRFDRRCHTSSHFGRQRAHFSGLRRQFADLLAPIRCLQFDSLGKILRPRQPLRKTEAGIDIAPSDVDSPTIER